MDRTRVEDVDGGGVSHRGLAMRHGNSADFTHIAISDLGVGSEMGRTILNYEWAMIRLVGWLCDGLMVSSRH